MDDKPIPHDPDAVEISERALLALFLSIVWLFGLGAIAGTVLGWQALREIRASNGAQSGKSLAIAAIATGSFGIGALAMVLVVAVDS